MKAGNDDLQMRCDWLLPLCTGGERLKDGDGRKPHPTQKPEALLVARLLAPPSPAMWCSIRSSAPARPARSPNARPPLHRHRARSRLRRSGARAHRRGRAAARRRRRRAAPSKRSEPRVAVRAPWSSRPDRAGRRCCSTTAAATDAVVRADGTRDLGPASPARSTRSARWCKACRPATAGPSGIIERNGRLAPIDSLRATMRQAMAQAAE